MCSYVSVSAILGAHKNQCPLRNVNTLLVFHGDVTTGVHVLMLALDGHFAYQYNSCEFLVKLSLVVTNENF